MSYAVPMLRIGTEIGTVKREDEMDLLTAARNMLAAYDMADPDWWPAQIDDLRAAVADIDSGRAMADHLGLTLETRTVYADTVGQSTADGLADQRRFVSKWETIAAP